MDEAQLKEFEALKRRVSNLERFIAALSRDLLDGWEYSKFRHSTCCAKYSPLRGKNWLNKINVKQKKEEEQDA